MEEQTHNTNTHIKVCTQRRMTMIPSYHDHEKFAQAHRQNLLNEAEHERLLAQLPKPNHSIMQRFLARPMLFLRDLRKRLQQRGKHRKQQITKHTTQ
jgi:hypothetical protein